MRVRLQWTKMRDTVRLRTTFDDIVTFLWPIAHSYFRLTVFFFCFFIFLFCLNFITINWFSFDFVFLSLSLSICASFVSVHGFLSWVTTIATLIWNINVFAAILFDICFAEKKTSKEKSYWKWKPNAKQKLTFLNIQWIWMDFGLCVEHYLMWALNHN